MRKRVYYPCAGYVLSHPKRESSTHATKKEREREPHSGQCDPVCVCATKNTASIPFHELPLGEQENPYGIHRRWRWRGGMRAPSSRLFCRDATTIVCRRDYTMNMMCSPFVVQRSAWVFAADRHVVGINDCVVTRNHFLCPSSSSIGLEQKRIFGGGCCSKRLEINIQQPFNRNAALVGPLLAISNLSSYCECLSYSFRPPASITSIFSRTIEAFCTREIHSVVPHMFFAFHTRIRMEWTERYQYI